MRTSQVVRQTKETKIEIALDLDRVDDAKIDTGIGFLDHMLTHIARHGLLALTVKAEGDLEIDAHHTVEDIGICLGKAFNDALGDSKGITRFGHVALPMDEALAEVSVDLSGRPFLVYEAKMPSPKVGDFDSELVEEFFRAFAMNSRATVHIVLRYGTNAHHCIEAIFKAFGRALSQACRLDPRVQDVPSTKGIL